MATLVDSFLLIPRELPRYFYVAYSIRYANHENEGNYFSRFKNIAHRAFLLIKELWYYRPIQDHFDKNRVRLTTDFDVMTKALANSQKPICVYFVSNHDHNGAILGDHLYYYHHYKIRGLENHFAVAPKLVSTQEEMKAFMKEIKVKYPERHIQVVDAVTHGSKSALYIHSPQKKTPITPELLKDDLFEECAPDATIILDACLTGLGDKNIADEIARKTPGRTVFAAGPSLYFSKPVITTGAEGPKVVGLVHGFAVFNAYSAKSFSYTHKMPSQFPYVKDESLKKDIFAIAHFPELQNSWLDAYLDEDNPELRQKVIDLMFTHLSTETKDLILNKIDKENPEQFVRDNPLHATVRSACRSVLSELIYEVRDFPYIITLAKAHLLMKNVVQAIRVRYQYLRN